MKKFLSFIFIISVFLISSCSNLDSNDEELDKFDETLSYLASFQRNQFKTFLDETVVKSRNIRKDSDKDDSYILSFESEAEVFCYLLDNEIINDDVFLIIDELNNIVFANSDDSASIFEIISNIEKEARRNLSCSDFEKIYIYSQSLIGYIVAISEVDNSYRGLWKNIKKKVNKLKNQVISGALGTIAGATIVGISSIKNSAETGKICISVSL